MAAAKATGGFMPHTPTSAISRTDVSFAVDPLASAILVRAKVEAHASQALVTEAIMAASAAAATIVDMLRYGDKWMTVGPVRLEEVFGGESGDQRRPA